MSVRQPAEALAQATTPVPIGVSGLTFMGVTFKDWVFIATAILVIFQIIVIAPKVVNVIINLFKRKPKDDCE